jgi:hypothetical protein
MAGELTLEVRTKPTMRKRTLRAVIAAAFSAGLLFGVAGAMDTIWDSGPADSNASGSRAVLADTIWDTPPVGASVEAPPADPIWDAEPADLAPDSTEAGARI